MHALLAVLVVVLTVLAAIVVLVAVHVGLLVVILVFVHVVLDGHAGAGLVDVDLVVVFGVVVWFS